MTSAWDEPVAHGRYGPWARKSANPCGIRVGALTSEGRIGAIPQELQGGILRIASLVKIEEQHSPSFLLIHIVDSTFHHLMNQMDSRQRLVSNAGKSLLSYIWPAGVATMSCCHGIQVFYLRNSLNFHKNGIQVRIKA